MASVNGLELTNTEVAKAFADPALAAKFGPILTIEDAAQLLQVPVETVRGWRSRGLLDACSHRVGRHVRFWRDRLVLWAFNDA
jgi:excisionase family DNA binding protein